MIVYILHISVVCNTVMECMHTTVYFTTDIGGGGLRGLKPPLCPQGALHIYRLMNKACICIVELIFLLYFVSLEASKSCF